MRLRGQFFAATASVFAVFGFAPAAAFAGPFGTGFTFDFTPDYGRPTKTGEHLGDYLIAERLPQSLPVPAARLPKTTVPLPPPAPQPAMRLLVSWNPEWDRPWVPKLGDLPPRPGEHLGEYALAGELPPRLPVAQPNLPTMAVPPGYHLDTGRRSFGSGPSTVGGTTAPTVPTDRVAFQFTGPGKLKPARQMPDGSFTYADTPKDCNFKHGDIYRLRITSAQPGKPVRVFYPSMEVALTNSKTETYVKHSAVPVVFTEDDFARVKAGDLVVKVIYLPNPDQQDFSTVASAEEVNSARLEPGVDPVAEAKRRGTILAIIRMGNIDLEERTRPRSDER